MKTNIDKEIHYIEHKFSRHLSADDYGQDTHLVKELITYKDGTTKPNLRVVRDFERPFYITRKHYRNHEQKKEFEYLDKLHKYTCTQSDLPDEIGAKLGLGRHKRHRYGNLIKSPYIYGSDIPSTTFISKVYEDTFGLRPTPYAVASLDIEVDVDHDYITIISVLLGDEMHTFVNRDLFKGEMTNILEGDIDAIVKARRVEITDRHLDLTVVLCDNESKCVVKAFKKLHKWKPDILAIWNVLYDMPKMEKALIANNLDPKKIFSDPDIPRDLRHYSVKVGKSSRPKGSSGAVTKIAFHNRWHLVNAHASFYILDAMTTYAQIRTGAPQVIGGYGIDNIAKRELGDGQGKLTFDDIDLGKVDRVGWHREMANRYPIEYIIYNIRDITIMEDLDRKTNDLRVVLPTLTGHSNFDYFNSGPKKIFDALYMDSLKENMILGTKPPYGEVDTILGLDEWIVMLDPNMMVLGSANVVKGSCDTKVDIHTNYKFHTTDVDVRAAYPTAGAVANISKTTTKREVIAIDGVDKETMRMSNLNLLTGPISAGAWCVDMLNAPTYHELLESIRDQT